MKITVAVAVFLLFLFAPADAGANLPLLIVEIQIAGDKVDNDFIRIYNPSDVDLDINGYKLRKRASTGSESSIRVFPQGSKILAKNYFLWANSKEDYADSIGADEKSTATLAKNNSIALLTPDGEIIDALAWGESQNPFIESLPFPENPAADQKLERKKISGVYQDTNNNGQDFYLNPSSEPASVPEPGSEPEPELEPTPMTEPEPQTESSFAEASEDKPEIQSAANQQQETEPQPGPQQEKTEIIYPSDIVINEILPYAEGPDAEEEWAEILNQNNFEVNISGWKIADAAGATKTYAFPEGTKIGPKGFLVLPRPATKITLNNDGDDLKLSQPNGNVIDSVTYGKAPRGQSYNRINSQWVWSTVLTPGSANIVPAPPAESETKKSTPQKELATVSEPLRQARDKQTQKTFLLFLVASAVAIFSGIIILTLKKKLKVS